MSNELQLKNPGAMALGALGGAKRALNPRKYELARLAGLASAAARKNPLRQSLPSAVSNNETGLSHFEQSAVLQEFKSDKGLLLKTLVSQNETDTLPSCPAVYGLFDPRTSDLKYIGATGNPRSRRRRHLQMRDDHASLQKWFNELKRLKLQPVFKVLSIENWKTLFSAEHAAIECFRSMIVNGFAGQHSKQPSTKR